MLLPIMLTLTSLIAGLWIFTIIQDYWREVDP